MLKQIDEEAILWSVTFYSKLDKKYQRFIIVPPDLSKVEIETLFFNKFPSAKEIIYLEKYNFVTILDDLNSE